MTLRRKLLLAQVPIAAALAIVGVASALIAIWLGRQSRLIMADNYRSVIAAQRMNEAVERIDRRMLAANVGGVSEDRGEIAGARTAFERELVVEENNITEPGEAAAVRLLRRTWEAYVSRVPPLIDEPSPGLRSAHYERDLTPGYGRIRELVAEILTINEDAMERKIQGGQRNAERFELTVIVAVLLVALLGLLVSTFLTSRFLRPLGVVHDAVRRFGEGELAVRAQVGGHDEIARLAAEFNGMADHLERFRASSLGELLAAQQAAQGAIDGLPDPVVILGANGAIEGVNLAATSMLNITMDATSGDPSSRAAPPVQSLLDRLRTDVVAEQRPYLPTGFEDAFHLAGDDGVRILLPRATPIQAKPGTVTGVAIVFQDVTRMFRFDEMRNNLVATVAHEFRTPLTSLRMALHLTLDGVAGTLTAKQAELLATARDDCERLQGIVDDLLNLARIESGRFDLHRRRLAVEPLLQTALDAQRPAAEQRNIAFRTEVAPNVSEVLADPDRIALVFSNLLANAVRYAPQDSAVVVRARVDPSDVKSPDTAPIRFEVVDRGPGISAQHRVSLFEKFYRVPGSPEGGSGLGLFIAKSIVQAQGGRIGLDSQPGHGATFWFTVPAAPPV